MPITAGGASSSSSSGGGLRVQQWDFGEIWATLRENILAILANPRQKPARSILQLDRDVHKITTSDKCTNMPQPRRLRDHQLGEPVAKRCLTIHLLLEEVLEHHINGVVLPAIQEKALGPHIIKCYVEAFDSYKIAMKIVQVVFRYLRGQAQRTKAGTQVHHDTWQLGMSVWRQELLQRIRQPFLQSILDTIEQDRREGGGGATSAVPPDQMRRAVMSLIQVADPRSPHSQYAQLFEQPFLQATGRYCRARVAEFEQAGTVELYMQGAMRMVQDESRRVSECFDRVTGPHLHKSMFAILVDERLQLLFSKFDQWIDMALRDAGPYNLKENGAGDLHRLYWLLQRSEQGLDMFRKKMEDRIALDGQARIKEAVETVTATLNIQSSNNGSSPNTASPPAVRMDSQQYQSALVDHVIQAVFTVFGSYHRLIVKVFENHTRLAHALNKGAKRFINEANAAWSQSSKAAEFLAKYLNVKLKSAEFAAQDSAFAPSAGVASTGIGYGSTSTGSAVLDEVNMAVQIFSLLNDRDVFQQWYSNLLSLRLVYARNSDTFNADNEQTVIQRIKQECGHDFTYKWSRMFHDAHDNSQQLKDKYLAYMATGAQVQVSSSGTEGDNSGGPEEQVELMGGPLAVDRLEKAGIDRKLATENFSPLILMSGSWPITVPAAAEVVLPTEPLLALFQEFERFYTKKVHQGRKLQFIPSLSWGVVKAMGVKRGAAVGSTPFGYECTVSHCQLCILLPFNISTTVRAADLLKAGVAAAGSEQAYEKQLAALVSKKLLVAEDAAATSYRYNGGLSFTSKKVSLLMQRVEAKGGAATAAAIGGGAGSTGQDVTSATLSDRRFALQAAIMRVMKTRKTVKHQELVAEVLQVLQMRFTATGPEVKANVEVLLEKEYMERSKEDPTVFNYLA